MFNLLLTIAVLNYLPFFMVPGAIQSVDLANMKKDTVLGESTEKDETETNVAYNYNKFPLDYFETGPTPIRKPDYGDIKIWAGSSVVIDVESGTILHYDNGRKRTQIASLTKLMTAVLAVEKIENFDEEVIITREALRMPGTVVGCPSGGICPSNRMYVGEKVYARDLLKAMLLNSANDAAASLAIHISGSEQEFVDTMNAKARSLGLKDTNFCTASGLETDGKESECYSSAYDIARIASYALKYPVIWEIMQIAEDRFYSTDGTYMHELKNTDILVTEMENCLGGKTGFTPLAGRSLLTAATDDENEHRIIAVLLNDDNRWEDMKTLVNWVFDNYEWR